MGFKVCPDCEGKGSKDNLGPFTSDDLDEWFGGGDERYEFLEQYKAGRFDRPCDYCDGERVVDDEKYEGWEDELSYRAEIAAERRMGA